MNTNDKKFIAQNIRAQYTEKQITELDELKALDAKVKKPARIFAITFGTISAVILGAGMSLIMTDIGEIIGLANAMPTGVVIGAIGLALSIANYPLYTKILASRKEKYADRIVKLSNKILEK